MAGRPAQNCRSQRRDLPVGRAPAAIRRRPRARPLRSRVRVLGLLPRQVRYHQHGAVHPDRTGRGDACLHARHSNGRQQLMPRRLLHLGAGASGGHWPRAPALCLFRHGAAHALVHLDLVHVRRRIPPAPAFVSATVRRGGRWRKRDHHEYVAAEQAATAAAGVGRQGLGAASAAAARRNDAGRRRVDSSSTAPTAPWREVA
mmetsp:Transcript_12364/g.28545  ORF Transcript_12364/g.28545 Transcript_12364/m.28545 type:complete len:202 (-) Transcript_12364:541-1146(-)